MSDTPSRLEYFYLVRMADRTDRPFVSLLTRGTARSHSLRLTWLVLYPYSEAH